jgi:hypothetical protein
MFLKNIEHNKCKLNIILLLKKKKTLNPRLATNKFLSTFLAQSFSTLHCNYFYLQKDQGVTLQ